MTSTTAPGDTVIALMRDAAHAVRSVTATKADELRALVAARDAINAAISEGLLEMDETAAHRDEDAATIQTWARRELRFDGAETRARLRSARTMRRLPDVAEHHRHGRVSAAHVRVFDFSVRHVGESETRELEGALLEVARSAEPAELKQVVRRFKAVVHPEALDDAWLRGMDRRDLQVHQVEDGWHVHGFLPIQTGARLHAVLASASVPTEAYDDRTAAQRRVDALDDLLARVLAEGLPTDGTLTPQLHVIVEAGTLREALAPGAQSSFAAGEPATLVGFGMIGANLLRHLACGATLTPVLVEKIEPNLQILDIGRAERFATRRQRHAIWLRQGGECATEGCRNSIDHIHHEIPWSLGGPTDLGAMTGRCAVCHTHVHARDGTIRRVA
ncbi:DUF222 domain-containing protein [Aeromicrobium sp. 636]|uniref:DUF222 domain-containing protein n=1 Tax=Aeromicrobium senzhongii TaxID=2663859 RepID=A0A8I0ETW9_9ACTN|nr:MULTISPECIES: HNH endonuclease [Aeromicrobium]MBC9225328.1 DUF222 domain-containing protein [Aeromicrobium senzhongii]MCQ3997438.1 DUF222 domain-containing protein [Aeromicrobium sp. 636]